MWLWGVLAALGAHRPSIASEWKGLVRLLAIRHFGTGGCRETARCAAFSARSGDRRDAARCGVSRRGGGAGGARCGRMPPKWLDVCCPEFDHLWVNLGRSGPNAWPSLLVVLAPHILPGLGQLGYVRASIEVFFTLADLGRAHPKQPAMQSYGGTVIIQDRRRAYLMQCLGMF